MFNPKAQAIIDYAKRVANARVVATLDLRCFVAAMAMNTEAAVLLADAVNLPLESLRRHSMDVDGCIMPSKFPLAEDLRSLLGQARELAERVPDRAHPGLVDVRHLSAAAAGSPEVAALLGVAPVAPERIGPMLTAWYSAQAETPGLDSLAELVRKLRSDLQATVFGQDHAIGAFVEGLFNAEVVATADSTRRAPRSVFVFAGPPGVGKTYLAELGARHLGRPFKRFDMSAYSGHQQNEALVGMAKSFHGAQPGVLTEFVEKNANAVLLFDEIEKSHAKTIHLFLQVLDAGVLEDKYHERNVGFRDTTIIFTTNVGRKLYDRPNSSGVHTANATFHRRTILDALQTEKNPETGDAFFPAAICSRMATGYPVLFNHLGVNELERLARAELLRGGALLERQYYKTVTFDELVPMCLVLREGAGVDARILRAQTEAFLRTELLKFCQLYKTDRLEEVFASVEGIHLALQFNESDASARAMFESAERPKILLAGSEELASLYKEHIPQVKWSAGCDPDSVIELLAVKDVDLVLLDIWMGSTMESGAVSLRGFDHVPVAARALDKGHELLRKIRERMPELPVYLLSMSAGGAVDEELFSACVRAGGARGFVESNFVDDSADWQKHRDQFVDRILECAHRLYREKAAARLAQERKVLMFNTAPRVAVAGRRLELNLRNLRLARAIAASDAGEVLEDVERPRVKFDDVIGADSAKDELRFFIDFLANPRRFAALGLKPPKGVLLHGPPGTGKTMLARAMAGESNVAFIPVSATSFVTMWQGSGPQNIRDLFARARRYAPAIIFIDEIDAIGKTRTGNAGGGRAAEETLNALLTEMDGFGGGFGARPVFVLAATNFAVEPDGCDATRALDPALVRRFSRTILVDLPERSARLQYLRKRLDGPTGAALPEDVVCLIADRSTGMSIANLESIIETAARNAIKRGVPLDGSLLEEAFEAVRFGEARVTTPEARLRTARHEAGHTLLYWLSGWCASYVTIVARGGHGGYMAPSVQEIEARGCRTREQLLADIRVCLAGRAAEVLYYGAIDGQTTGASSDIEHASLTARSMICRFGMDEEFGLLGIPELMRGDMAMSSPLYAAVHPRAAAIVKSEFDRTVEMLTEHRVTLDALVDSLIQNERLTSDQLHRLLTPANVA